MRAMILAAGRGERMRPLTDHLPKPLLSVGGQPLIAWHLQSLAQAGFREVFINTAHLAQKLEDHLGDGRQWGLLLHFSREPEGALETAGGIATAHPWRSEADPFLVINGDIFCRWPVDRAITLGEQLKEAAHGGNCLAHLVMVPNPQHHPQGDFGLLPDGQLCLVADSAQDSLTYSGIGVFMPGLFKGIRPGTRTALGPLLKSAIAAGQIRGEAYTGHWTDVGTPDRLAALNQLLHGATP